MMPTDSGDRPLHVLHIIVGLGIGGAELMLARLVDVPQDQRVIRHTVISLTTEGPVGARLREAGIETHALGFKGLFSVALGFWRLRALIRRLAPNVVQTWMYHADLIGGLAARSAGIRSIVWGVRATFIEHDGAPHTRWVARMCAAMSAKVPAAIICAAESSRRVHVAMGYDAGKMLVIPNGFDFLRLSRSMSERDSRRANFGFTADTIAVGAVGRFSPVKGFRNFVNACREVAARLPQARFILIGRGLTETNRELKGWLNASGLEDRFMLLGERDDVPACLAALDIFCLSSSSEGFPNVVGEAMCVGVPCVVTDVGDAALLIGGHGEVVPREDSVALGQALLRVARLSDAERRTIGRAAQQRIENQFSMELARSRFENTYLDLARTDGVPR